MHQHKKKYGIIRYCMHERVSDSRLLVGRLIEWLIGWLIDCLVGKFQQQKKEDIIR